MKIVRIIASLMCLVLLTGMLAACNDESGNNNPPRNDPQGNANTGNETTGNNTISADRVDAGIEGFDFSNQNIKFLDMYYKPTDASPDAKLELGSFGGASAAKITPVAGSIPYIVIDAASLLGARVTDVATVEIGIAVENPDGGFEAVSGEIIMFKDWQPLDRKGEWSVYIENRNPNIARMTLNEPFNAGEGNFIVIVRRTDNAEAAGRAPANLYITRVGFLDADGAYLDVDSDAAFIAPEGFNEAVDRFYELPEMNLRNSNFHQGWFTDGTDSKESPYLAEEFSQAYKLVLEFTNPPKSEEFQLVWQGNGDGWTWHQNDIPLSDIESFIEGNTLTFPFTTHLLEYDAWKASTQMKLILGYEYTNEDTGEKEFIESLGITRAYLVIAE